MACCEEAVTRLEFGLIISAVINIDSPNDLIENARSGAKSYLLFSDFIMLYVLLRSTKTKLK